MNKKILSILVILCTLVCVYIMVFMDSIDLRNNTVGNKFQVFKEKITDKKTGDKLSCEEKKQEKQEKQEEQEEQKEQEKQSKVSEAPKENTYKFNSIASSEQYKKFKSDEVTKEIEEDKKNFSVQNESVNKRVDKEVTNSNSEKNKKESKNSDVSVFKVDKFKIEDKMTLLDKERLLSVASKLSAIDYEKIRTYIQSGKDEDIVNVIKLLKERLSDKDYNKAKEIMNKFINMDVIK